MRVFIDTITTGNDMNLTAREPNVIVTFSGKMLLDKAVLNTVKDMSQLSAMINSRLDDGTTALAISLLLRYPENEDVLELVSTIFGLNVPQPRIPTSEDASKWAITTLRELRAQ